MATNSKPRLQLFNKSVVTVFLNANFDVTDSQLGPTRDHGYLWRSHSYWRVQKSDAVLRARA